ncbi:MAG: DUF1800 domain-containing protein [Ilumatobacter sp.]
MPDLATIKHLLRRTEYVARPHRVGQLSGLATLEQCVDDILAVPADPGSVVFRESEPYLQGEELVHFWLDRMAHDSPRPIQERMAFFWHGHFCSELNKVHGPVPMREQIDTFRREGFGNLRTLTKRISRQIAMLRYLDNNLNQKASPNENFGRELMELFLLGVGNYTEQDVRASALAWTGHTDTQGMQGVYVWRGEWHDSSPKSLLGGTINTNGAPQDHGDQVIDHILSGGVVPGGAARNVGRPTREVAAEFISRKLWIEFAGTQPPQSVLDHLRSVAVANNFEIRPWVRALLLHPEFYSTSTRQGLVRSPVSFVVAVLVANGLRSNPNVAMWRLPGMGQMPLYPPDVSGWPHNEGFLNAASVAQRMGFVRDIAYRVMPGYWGGDGLIHLAGGTISQHEVENVYPDRPDLLTDRFLELMRVDVSPTTRDVLVRHAQNSLPWERVDLVSLILSAPEFQMM